MRHFITLRQNTPWLATGMNGNSDAPKSRRRRDEGERGQRLRVMNIEGKILIPCGLPQGDSLLAGKSDDRQIFRLLFLWYIVNSFIAVNYETVIASPDLSHVALAKEEGVVVVATSSADGHRPPRNDTE